LPKSKKTERSTTLVKRKSNQNWDNLDSCLFDTDYLVPNKKLSPILETVDLSLIQEFSTRSSNYVFEFDDIKPIIIQKKTPIAKLSIYGPIYFNKNEFYCMPNEPGANDHLDLLYKSYLIDRNALIYRDSESSLIYEVKIDEFIVKKPAPPRRGRKPQNNNYSVENKLDEKNKDCRIGYIRSPIDCTSEGCLVWFDRECGGRGERLSVDRITLFDAVRRDEEVEVKLEKEGTAHKEEEEGGAGAAADEAASSDSLGSEQ
jgi:hypothetical protein